MKYTIILVYYFISVYLSLDFPLSFYISLAYITIYLVDRTPTLITTDDAISSPREVTIPLCEHILTTPMYDL